MKNIEINIGNACNNLCRFCMIEYEDDRKFMPGLIIQKEIIKAKQQGYQSIGFLGGEFTLHPDVFKLIKISKLLGFETIHIISNGRQYHDLEFVEKLIKNGANRFSVSIHSHLPEVEDYLTQRIGGFAEKLAGLKNLLALYKEGKIANQLSLNLVLNGLNYKDILATLEFFSQLGVKDFRLNFIWLHGRANKFPELNLKYSEFLPLIDEIINYAQQANITLAFEGIPPCLIKSSEKMQYLGELKDSAEIVAYNNPQQAREQFNWQERKKHEFKVKHDKCQSCTWDKNCDGVWQDYINNYGWQEFNF